MRARRLPRTTRLVAGAVAALALAALPARTDGQQRETRVAQLDRDAEFRIWNPAGSVHVIGWDKDSVRVDADLDAAAGSAFLFGAGGAGGKLSTGDDGGAAGVARLTVRVPRGASVWIKTSSASIIVNGVTGAIDAYAVTGNVTIASPSAASVYAESLGGRVHVTGQARVVRLRTGRGSVEFSGRTPDLSVRTVSGSVFARAAGIERGTIESVGGRVHLGVSLRRGGTLEVLTHDGDVDLTLPARAPVRWLLSTVSGDVRVVDPLPRAERGDDETIVVGGARRGLDLPRSAPGGAAIELRTFSGSITLRGAQ